MHFSDCVKQEYAKEVQRMGNHNINIFQFKHGGRIVVELVEGGNDPPAAPACQDCAAVIRNSDIMDCVR